MTKYNGEDIANAIVEGLVGEISSNTANVQQSSNKDSSDCVRRLQEKCNRQGVSNQVVDGIFRSGTLSVVKKSQKERELTGDGIKGKLLWGKLFILR